MPKPNPTADPDCGQPGHPPCPPVEAAKPIKKPSHPKGDDGPTNEQLIDSKENLGI